MGVVALIGLALLPPAFLFSAFLLPARLTAFFSLFVTFGLMTALLFFTALAGQVPALAIPLGILDWGIIAMFILYIALELLNLLSFVLLGMLNRGN